MFNVVEEMTIAAGLPQVRRCTSSRTRRLTRSPPAATRHHASIAVTRGLLQQLDREELQGVIAHEMSHIRNFDIRFATLVGILVGMIALVADFFLRFAGSAAAAGAAAATIPADAAAIMLVVAIVLAILAPLAAYAVQFAISRRREYLADASGVELTRNPLGLARALNVIAGDPGSCVTPTAPRRHLYIANPLRTRSARNGRPVRHPSAHPEAHRRAAGHGARGPDALTAPAGAQAQPGDAAQPGGAAQPPAPGAGTWPDSSSAWRYRSDAGLRAWASRRWARASVRGCSSQQQRPSAYCA